MVHCKVKSSAGTVFGAGVTGPAEGYIWKIFAIGQIQDATGIAGYIMVTDTAVIVPLNESVALAANGVNNCYIGDGIIDFGTYIRHSSGDAHVTVRIWYQEIPVKAAAYDRGIRVG